MTPEKLEILKDYAIEECEQACEVFGINMSAAITCGKPEGTGSLLVDCSAGMKPREGEYMIRRVRISSMDPLAKLLKAQGAPMVPESGDDQANPRTWVVEFPVKCSKNALFKDDLTALEQLEWYRKVQGNWCEHNQSCTIRVGDDEWFDVGAKVYEMRDEIVAVSFLPDDGGNYPLLPEEAITEEEYRKRKEAFPKINYADLSRFEEASDKNDDMELGPAACTGDRCSIND